MVESEKTMPIDIKPSKVVVLNDDGNWGTVVDGYTSHFATCPDADRFRKKKGK
jgi:hypothetical protein